MMKKIIIYIFAILFTFPLMISCNPKGPSETEMSLKQENDSLLKINEHQQAVLDQMTSAMAEIAFCLDTISIHEKVVMTGIDEDGNRLSRQGIRKRLEILAQVISEQKERLGVLEENFRNSTLQIGELHSIIEFLETSLAQKDREVENLKAQVSTQSFNISMLEEQVTLMNDTIKEERTVNAEQRQQIAQQEVQLNEVYYIIGPQALLLRSGVIKKEGKLFKKTKIDFSTIDKSLLTKGDIRTLTSIKINGRSPKILSDLPKGSYSLDKLSDNSYILNILDPKTFWSANNRILVIQVK